MLGTADALWAPARAANATTATTTTGAAPLRRTRGRRGGGTRRVSDVKAAADIGVFLSGRGLVANRHPGYVAGGRVDFTATSMSFETRGNRHPGVRLPPTSAPPRAKPNPFAQSRLSRHERLTQTGPTKE